ncbi:hypothetical protein E3V33_03685 [Candidatus Marinimicrobia bacterium MT.SAG.4]|nr:hypothetical protein E3V33_03685 [Candidatus Marinimicrobia bacterium MT.SAG.4]
MRFKNFLIAAVCAAAVGCGPYSFSGSSIPSHIKSVAIPIFENETAEFGIKEKVTDALLENFISENILKISDKKNADSIIRGTIMKITDVPFTFDENEIVQDYRVTIYLNLVWHDQVKDNDLFDGKINGWGVYPANSPEERDDGIEKAIERLITEITNKTLSGW